MNTAVYPDLIERFGSDFSNWMEDQNLTEREKVVWLFHYYERYGTDLNSGSVVDYRKYAAKYLNESGELLDCLDDLNSHERAAVNKFREAEEADLKSISVDNAKIDAKGENQH